MANMKKSKIKRIIKSTSENGVSYIIGLSGLPFPINTIKEFIKIKAESSPASFVDWKLSWHKIYSQELGNCVGLTYNGERISLPQVLIFDNTKRKFPLSKIKFQLISDFFEIRNDIQSLTEDSFEKLLAYLRKKRRYSNEQNLRLVNFIEEYEGAVLIVQPVEYKYFVHTNLVLDVKSKGKEQTLREYLHCDGKLEDFEESPLANHLGINILLFTADGSLIMQKRSKEVAFRTKELCSAASGAISLTDVSTELTLEDMPKLREAFEEIGISKKDILSDKIFFLGITRELIRGGKPEMFFFGKTNLSEKQTKEKWKDAKDKWESKKLIFFNFGQIAHKELINSTEQHKFLSKIDEFLDKYIDMSSIPLLTSVALFVQYRMLGN